jgi:hypothetical protein
MPLVQDDLNYEEVVAWSRDPATVARMDQIVQENRAREWAEYELAQKQLKLEREEQERSKAQAKVRAEAAACREERAQRYGLKIRHVHYEQRGEHSIWRTNHKTKRMVHGLASTPTINSHKYSLDSSQCRIVLPIPLLVAHEKIGSVGEIVMVRRSPREIYVIGALHDNSPASDYAWELVQQGTLKAFSGAAEPGSATAVGSVLDVKFYGQWTLSEVSLCLQGANPDCRTEIFSSRRKVF